jgi:hypothetical protein
MSQIWAKSDSCLPRTALAVDPPAQRQSFSVPLAALAAALLVGSCVRLTLGFFHLSTPFPDRQGLREAMLRPPERLDKEVHRLRGLHGMANRVRTLFTSVGNEADRVGPTSPIGFTYIGSLALRASSYAPCSYGCWSS